MKVYLRLLTEGHLIIQNTVQLDTTNDSFSLPSLMPFSQCLTFPVVINDFLVDSVSFIAENYKFYTTPASLYFKSSFMD
jgi:hypothetical protein